MSDEDEIVYVKKQKTIHYGSLEQEMENRLRNEVENSQPVVPSSSSSAATSSAKIPEYFDIDEEM